MSVECLKILDLAEDVLLNGITMTRPTNAENSLSEDVKATVIGLVHLMNVNLSVYFKRNH